MGLFNRPSKNKIVEDEVIVEEKIETIDLNKVICIDVNNNDKSFSSRFFMGKKHNGVNYEITIGIKDIDYIKEKDYLKLTFNLLNSDRYVQNGFVDKKSDKFIIISLDKEIIKLEEKRRNLKMCCDMSGTISVLDKDIYVDLKNISVGGVFVKTDYVLPVNHSIKLYINELDIRVKLIILRKQKNSSGVVEGYGCTFDDLSEKQEEVIVQYINFALSKERETLISRDVYNYIFDNFT